MYIHTSSILYCTGNTPVSKLILHVFITENGNLHIYKGDMDEKKYEPGNKNKSDNNKEQKKNNIDHLQISSK